MTEEQIEEFKRKKLIFLIILKEEQDLESMFSNGSVMLLRMIPQKLRQLKN